MTAPAAYAGVRLAARDPLRLGRFWAAALRLELTAQGDEVVLRGPTAQHTVRVARETAPRTVKNRVHLDVHTGSVEELLGLGATVDHEQSRWTVMADPEGGEFCAFVRAEPPADRLYEVGVDCADPRPVARWWAALLGGRYVDQGKDFVWINDIPGAPFESLDFAPVPEPKRAPNRVRLDVIGEVDAIVARGATVVAQEGGRAVLADPEGNEFGVVPPS